MSTAFLGAVCCAAMLASPALATAQLSQPDPTPAGHWTAPRWMGDVAFGATNALVAGVTAGVSQWLRGGDFRDGFTRGAAGGVVAYTGRRIGAERFDGAGLVGRQVSAVGASMARNAGDGRPTLERLFLPLGPLHLYVERAEKLRVRPKLHVIGVAQAARLALREETTLDWGASLSAGAPVFRAPGRTLIFHDNAAVGMMLHGSIVLGEHDRVDPASLFAHERVHVMQGDYAFLAWSEPAEAWLFAHSRHTRAIYRYLDFGGVTFMAALGAAQLGSFGFENWPHELEARFLQRR